VNYSKVINAVFNPDPQMPCTELHKGLGIEVYRIDTSTPLVVRFAHGDEGHFKFQAELMEAIAANDEITPRIHYWEMNETTKPLNGIQVQSFLPGIQLDRYPSSQESKAIVTSVYTIHQRLCDVSGKFGPDTCSTLYDVLTQSLPYSWTCTWPTCATVDDVIKSYFSKIDDCSIKAAANNLLQHKRYNELFVSEQQYLYWPESLDRQDLYLLMQIFPIVIGLKAECTYGRFPKYTQEHHNSNIRLLMECLNNIRKWL
jgi:hypothetical protein